MSDYETAMKGMKSALEKHESLIQGFTRKLYAETFQSYYMGMVPAMDAIENLYGNVVDKDTMLGNMAQAVVDSARGILDSAKRREREQVRINVNLTMVAYLYPTLLKYQGESSGPLVDRIAKDWKETFPGSNMTPSDYETIESGFHKKFCFITTACCRSRNKPDDCYELTLLRSYRDNYMASLKNGEELISMYYDVAPSIVKHIDRRPDADSIYDGIWNIYILPCIRLIEAGKYEECLDLYMKMVMDLKEKYFFTYQADKAAVC